MIEVKGSLFNHCTVSPRVTQGILQEDPPGGTPGLRWGTPGTPRGTPGVPKGTPGVQRAPLGIPGVPRGYGVMGVMGFPRVPPQGPQVAF